MRTTAGTIIRTYIATLVVFVVLDALWLGSVGVTLFQQQVGQIMRSTPDWPAIALFYVVYGIGLSMLAVVPAAVAGRPRAAIGSGALLGFTAYATFDLSNLAVIEGWTWSLALVDMSWGTIASAVSAAAGYQAARYGRRAGANVGDR